MSKTYRFDLDSKAHKDKRKHRKSSKKDRANTFPEGWDYVNGCIDPLWAINRMEKRINFVVSGLIEEGLILESEREDYISRYNEQLIRLSGNYDPSFVGPNGKPASPLHYLRIIEGGLTGNIREYALYRKKYARVLSIASTQEEAETVPGMISPNKRPFSDECRTVKQLELRMDVDTLFAMLDVPEGICLSMRIEGFSQEDVALEISRRTGKPCDRDDIRKSILLRLQAKARKCGFYPPSEEKSLRL